MKPLTVLLFMLGWTATLAFSATLIYTTVVQQGFYGWWSIAIGVSAFLTAVAVFISEEMVSSR